MGRAAAPLRQRVHAPGMMPDRHAPASRWSRCNAGPQRTPTQRRDCYGPQVEVRGLQGVCAWPQGGRGGAPERLGRQRQGRTRTRGAEHVGPQEARAGEPTSQCAGTRVCCPVRVGTKFKVTCSTWPARFTARGTAPRPPPPARCAKWQWQPPTLWATVACTSLHGGHQAGDMAVGSGLTCKAQQAGQRAKRARELARALLAPAARCL